LIRVGPEPAAPDAKAAFAALVKRVTPDVPEEFQKSIHRLTFTNGLLAAVVQMRGLLTKAFQERGGPWLRQVRTFKLTIVGSTKSWERVAAMPLMGHLRNLDVSGCGLGKDGLAGLIPSPHFKGLYAINLGNNRLSRPESLKPLVEGCPERARVLQTPPMSSERRKEIDRRRRRRERALKARKHEAIKAAAATKKKK
jgi:hypothetical protein